MLGSMKKLLAGLVVLGMGGCAVQDAAWVSKVDAWSAKREAGLRSETGWLTLVGLHELKQGQQSIGGLSGADIVLNGASARLGVLDVIGDSVTFTADRGAVVERFGEESGRVQKTTMVIDTDGSPTVLMSGPHLFHVIKRGDGGELFLRVKNRNAETLAHFKGVDRYAVKDKWRVTAKLVPQESDLGVPTVLGLVETSPSPGVLVFELGGEELRLTPTISSNGGLFIVFGDATNGNGTYPGGRFLDTDDPDADGNVLLDFNMAHNPMCAFTAFATCPLPPAGNTLTVGVRAGEKYTPNY